ncbi:hypothetical protein Q3G72_023143 [Acer saccharum]|nr:hypothetical protein Q3G72_023143 [Acer saccharum]
MPKMGSFLLLFFFIFPVFVQSQNTSFIFEGFNGAANNLTLELEASIMNNPRGVLRLTNKSNNVIGRAFYNKQIQMIDKASSPNASSFSTSFVFEIVPPSSGSGGYGLAFLLAPSTQLPGAEAGWSFQLNGVVAPPLNVSKLPRPPPREKISASYDGKTVALISSLCVVTVLLMDDILPFVDDWGSADYSQQGSEFGSRTFQISDGTFKTSHRSHRSYSYRSHHSYSSTEFSSSSIYSGR